jgi:hypothetical protein
MTTPNPYLDQVHAALPRVLALFDRNPASPTLGQGDRFWWAWKWIDFGNGTFQGAAHGLARLVSAGLLPSWLPEESAVERIMEMFAGARGITRPNGSMEEAFPNESSFCVTALVAFDLLNALDLLGPRLSSGQRKFCLDTVRPLIAFLSVNDEEHGFISNHLATAAAALVLWTDLSGLPGEERGRLIWESIRRCQSSEGWFLEYQGADPGYQTLCTYYLAALHRLRPGWGIREPLARSIVFLSHFIHPDGSLGGLYGSRNTRFHYPAGLEFLADDIPEAAAIAAFMRSSVANQTVVTLAAMDEPNLMPMFNAYCWAAAVTAAGRPVPPQAPPLPCHTPGSWRRRFDEAGLLVDKGPDHYTVVSWHKGGVVSHFRPGSRRLDAGVLLKDHKGGQHSSQAFQPDNEVSLDGDCLTVTAPLCAVRMESPTPIKFFLLRLFCLTVFRSARLGNLVKRALVRHLITARKPTGLILRRVIRLGPELSIEDRLQGCATGFQRLEPVRPFSAIYMASQGYWQRQDDQP